MFLSDKLEEIISESGCFDFETCNRIIHAIADKVQEEMGVFCKTAKERGFINSNVIYAAIERQRNTFNQFCKKHPEVPQVLIDKVENNLCNYRSLVDKTVERNLL